MRTALLLTFGVLIGCSSGGGGGGGGSGSPNPNAMTPGGVPVLETAAIAADPTFEAELFDEIDAEHNASGTPPVDFLIVLHDELEIGGIDRWGKYSLHDRRIDVGTSRTLEDDWTMNFRRHIPDLRHQYEHAFFETYCTPDHRHDAERRCP